MKLAREMLVAAVTAASSLACGSSESKAVHPPLVHVQGDRLVDASGAPLGLEGLAFGEVSPEEPYESEGTRAYAEVARMGLNHVRLYFDAASLEDETSPGSYRPEALASLDANVGRARKNGLYLVLSLGVPPGGTARNCGNDAFWDTAEYRDRFVELWRMLAARYADEPVVAGYALLDPPNPSRSLEQWQELAERTTQAIRQVDGGHTLFVARALSLNCKFDRPASESFFRVDDANVVYEFDRLQPWSYVAQLITPSWDPEQGMLPERGPYPDESIAIDPAKEKWLFTPQDTRPSPKHLDLAPDETEWTKKAFYYTVTEPQVAFALPALQADSTSGKAYFDDILIEEVSETGETRVLKDIDLESNQGWYFWQGNDLGDPLDGPGVVSVEDTAHRGQASVAISGTTSRANLAGKDGTAFLVDLGHTYRVTSWVKGENIEARDSARVRLDFKSYSEPLHAFNRRALEALFTDFRSWGHAQGVPMSVNSFGTARPSFENDRGGLAYLSDMIDIMREQQLGWTYFGYRDQGFGIYTNPIGVPDPETENRSLVELLTDKRR